MDPGLARDQDPSETVTNGRENCDGSLGLLLLFRRALFLLLLAGARMILLVVLHVLTATATANHQIFKENEGNELTVSPFLLFLFLFVFGRCVT